VKRSNGETALDIAKASGHTELIKIFQKTMLKQGAVTSLSFGELEEKLLMAAGVGNILEVKSLLDKGAQINLKRRDGATALMLAS